MTGITLKEGTYGRRAVLNSGWAAGMAEYFISKGIVELELNQAKGWRGGDLSFLPTLANLKLFEIFDFNIKDISPIHSLSGLRRLGITTYCSTEIRFFAFPALESCGLEWRPKAKSLFDCRTLKSVFINRYKGKDTAAFAKLVNLESLGILNAPIENLQGLRALKGLRKLRLGNLRKLTSIEGIEGLTGLEELRIDTCRNIGSIDPIASLFKLRFLDINNDGAIASLKPIEKLNRLERVTFYESTDILDGDLSPLKAKESLSSTSFKNRRHYSHKREEFWQYGTPG